MIGRSVMALCAALALVSCKPSSAPGSLLDTGWFSDTAGADTDTDPTTGCDAQIIQTSPEADAVDWYWQAPQAIISGWYNWYVLVDVNEPSQWYQARRIETHGMRDIDDTLPQHMVLHPPAGMTAI